MRKTFLAVALFGVMLSGCGWEQVEAGANTVKETGETALVAVRQVEQAFPVATGATAVVLGITNIAAGVAAFAARRKAKKIAAAASSAADQFKDGGKTLVNAASVLGVAADIAKVYAEIKSTSVSPK